MAIRATSHLSMQVNWKFWNQNSNRNLCRICWPPHVMPLFRRRHNTIIKGPEVVDRELRENPLACPKQPYWDPILKSDEKLRGQFIGQLNQVGIVGFSRSIKASVGLFFVNKKDPAFIRMVVDARISNFHHVDPPITRLGSGANFTELELNPDILGAKIGTREHGPIGYGAELDVADCFWQFRVDELAEWFGIRMPRPAKVWREFGADTSGFEDNAVMTGMAMGWKWALFFANEVVASITKRSQPSFPLELREKMPVSQLLGGPNNHICLCGQCGCHWCQWIWCPGSHFCHWEGFHQSWYPSRFNLW